jgi:3-deoxy-D-manno-octulosonic-acid transferase
MITEFVPNADVKVLGDSRFDQVRIRAANNPKNHFKSSLDKPIVVLGSIIENDYEVIFPAIKKFLINNHLHIVAVPHEVDNRSIEFLETYLAKLGLTNCRYSDSLDFCQGDVTIVDTVGILAELYYYGKYAYVGAGFGEGVHSVIEPAIYNIPVSYGPNISIASSKHN